MSRFCDMRNQIACVRKRFVPCSVSFIDSRARNFARSVMSHAWTLLFFPALDCSTLSSLVVGWSRSDHVVSRPQKLPLGDLIRHPVPI